jgi:hypothetical protein
MAPRELAVGGKLQNREALYYLLAQPTMRSLESIKITYDVKMVDSEHMLEIQEILGTLPRLRELVVPLWMDCLRVVPGEFTALQKLHIARMENQVFVYGTRASAWNVPVATSTLPVTLTDLKIDTYCERGGHHVVDVGAFSLSVTRLTALTTLDLPGVGSRMLAILEACTQLQKLYLRTEWPVASQADRDRLSVCLLDPRRKLHTIDVQHRCGEAWEGTSSAITNLLDRIPHLTSLRVKCTTTDMCFGLVTRLLEKKLQSYDIAPLDTHERIPGFYSRDTLPSGLEMPALTHLTLPPNVCCHDGFGTRAPKLASMQLEVSARPVLQCRMLCGMEPLARIDCEFPNLDELPFEHKDKLEHLASVTVNVMGNCDSYTDVANLHRFKCLRSLVVIVKFDVYDEVTDAWSKIDFGESIRYAASLFQCGFLSRANLPHLHALRLVPRHIRADGCGDIPVYWIHALRTWRATFFRHITDWS